MRVSISGAIRTAETHAPHASKDGPHMHGTSREVWLLGLNKAQTQPTLALTGIISTCTLIHCPLSHADCSAHIYLKEGYSTRYKIKSVYYPEKHFKE